MLFKEIEITPIEAGPPATVITDGLGVPADASFIVMPPVLLNVCAIDVVTNRQHANTSEVTTESFVNFWIICFGFG
jgi:hypothetical protein